MKNRQVQLRDLGQLDFKNSWDLQEDLLSQTLRIKSRNRDLAEPESTPNHFLWVEHPHVYTLGRNGNQENLLASQRILEQKGATFHKINRGGDITYHGPGQLVGYPILDLDNFFSDIHKYLRFLEEVIIRTMADYGLKGERSEGETGVWLDTGTSEARKICAMGIRASRWVTMHGFAFNVNADLSYFDLMIPCGIKDKGVTSLEKELGAKIPLGEVKEKIEKHFEQVFDAQLVKS